jgi:secondary thiamine-phosphate synthase enzyme
MLETLQINSPGHNAMMDITNLVSRKIQDSGIKNGLCLLHVPHTTAGIIVNEGADPAVMDDIIVSLDKLVPRQAGYKHDEGNSAAHIKAVLVGGRTFLMIEGGRLMLGTWERIFFCEFDGPRTRKVYIKIMETP